MPARASRSGVTSPDQRAAPATTIAPMMPGIIDLRGRHPFFKAMMAAKRVAAG